MHPAGANDTLRRSFDRDAVAPDLDALVGSLAERQGSRREGGRWNLATAPR